MAQVTSGTVNTNAYDGRYYQLTWNSSQSVENNQTTINWTLKAVGGNVDWYAERTLVVVIGGVTVYSKSARVERYAGVIESGTRVVNHNSAGDAHIDISIQAAVYTSSVNCSGSGSFDLNNIPRKSTLTVENGTLGTAQTLTVKKNGSSFTHTITYKCGSASGTICEKSDDTSISFTPPLSLASQNTTGESVNVKYTITTYNGTTSIGSNEYTKTCAIPASVVPSLSLAVSEATALTMGVYLQSVSRLDVAITATAAYGSAIASYKTTIDGKAYTESAFVSDVIKGKGSIEVSTTITDKRGRTATAKKTISVIEYNLPSVKNLSVTRCNEDGTANTKGAFVKVSYDYTFNTISGKNALTLDTTYKKRTDSAYTTISSESKTANGTATKIFAAATNSAYEVKVIATDTVCTMLATNPTSEVANVGTASKFMSWCKDIGISFGKVFDTSKPKSLQIGWDIYDKYDMQIRNGMAAYNSAGIDANTTLEHHILTQTNTPNATFHHVITYFYNDKTATSNRVQMAIPYKTPTVTYHRYYLNGEWSEWLHEGLSAYPIGSYYIAHHDTSPAELFGGSWHRIESRFLWACPATSEIGLTGGERDHTLTVNEMPSHRHDGLNYSSTTSAITLNTGSSGYRLDWTANGGNGSNEINTKYTGGGAAHNNMPPYVNVAIWRRTA